MTDRITLPPDLSQIDADRLNERLRDGDVGLDWSGVDQVTPDVLTHLLDGLALDLHGDQLGLDTVPDRVQPLLLEAFGLAPGEETLPKDGVRSGAVWLVLQSDEAEYGDETGKVYEYPTSIPNGQRVAAGDHVICAKTAKEAADGRRIFGIARVGRVTAVGDDRRRAVYDRYLELPKRLAFSEIGGDPRSNRTNSLNRVADEVLHRALSAVGVTAEALKPVTSTTGVSMETSYEVRDVLHETVVKDLLGPANGAREEVSDSRVSDRYLLGGLAPRDAGMDGMVDDDELGGAGDDSAEEGGSPEAAAAPERSLFPSSMGMTFTVDGDADEILVTAEWGRYLRDESDELETQSGELKQVWRREPRGGDWYLDLAPGPVDPKPVDDTQPGVVVKGLIRRNEDDDWVVTLFLVNEQPKPDTLENAAWIFQPKLTVEAADKTSAVFTRRRPVDASENHDTIDGQERAMLVMLYRRNVEFAVGHGVSVRATTAKGGWERATRIETTFVPDHDVPLTEAPTDQELAEEFDGFEGFVVDMGELAAAEDDELVDMLRCIPDLYERWIEKQAERIGREPDLEAHSEAADEAIRKARRALERLQEGCEVLADPENADARDAFRFANEAMAEQRIRSMYSLLRRRGEDIDLASLDVAKNRSWRPFQLAFILLTIPTVTQLDHEDRIDPVAAVADLLWFPTGGGKTEAYLGVAAYTMALRRLQGVVGEGALERVGDGGVTVIMRYTLRLLTLQQFQRATTLMCALDLLRQRKNTTEDGRWGHQPFRIGLWVGNKSTPGRTEDASEWVKRQQGAKGWDAGAGSSSPLQLTNCPWCGEKLSPNDLKVETFQSGRGRTLLYCSDKRGICEFTPRKAGEEGIPIVVVDDEIYRLLPTLLLATVDKFAQMPWRGEASALFGRVTAKCERHGFLTPEHEANSSSDRACAGAHPKKGRFAAVVRQDHPWLRPPDLVIQDELHLISGPLGTMVGLYETAVDELSTWKYSKPDGEVVGVRPKVIASTATTRRAPKQVQQLFLRSVDIFPPSGLDVSDNFFSRQREPSPKTPGRRYLGVCAPGKSRPATLIRVYVAYLTAAQHLYEELGAQAKGELVDPYLTLLGYFNSLRELGGMRRLVDDDVKTRVFRVNLSDPDGLQSRPGMAQRQLGDAQELTSRMQSSEIPDVLDRLELAFPDTPRDRAKKRPKGEVPPIDVILSTNMVSVGVDIQRLGLMVVAGQPKTTAEYIQATSRVGRSTSRPGVVCSVLNWSRPRDLSHYETFEHYHATFYQHVEALSVTPFAPRALERGLTGVMASLVRLQDGDYTANGRAGDIQLDDPDVDEALDAIAQRAWSASSDPKVKKDVDDGLQGRLHAWKDQADEPSISLVYKLRGKGGSTDRALLKSPGTGEWEPFTTLNSLREVEPNVGLILRDGSDEDLPTWEWTSGGDQ